MMGPRARAGEPTGTGFSYPASVMTTWRSPMSSTTSASSADRTVPTAS